MNDKKATFPGGALQKIPNCFIEAPNMGKIEFYILPDITDSKSAAFAGENIMGRSSPMLSFSHSEARNLSISIHFLVNEKGDATYNLSALRLIQSLVYPRDAQEGVPYYPPPICQIQCNQLLSDNTPICAVMKSYSVKFPTDVAWDADTYLPVKFDVETTWEVVYASSKLPGAQRIMNFGA